MGNQENTVDTTDLQKVMDEAVKAKHEAFQAIMNKLDPLGEVTDDVTTFYEVVKTTDEVLTQALTDALGEMLEGFITAHIEAKFKALEAAKPAAKERAPRKKKAPAEEAPAETTEAITFDVIRERATAFMTADMVKNKKVVVLALKKFGAANLTKLDEKDYAAFLEMIENG